MKLSKKFDFSAKNGAVCFLGSEGALFLDANIEQTPFKSGVILPSLYYAKIETLPVNSAKKAKELASAIFDGFLPSAKKYRYCAKKLSQNVFCLIAWNDEEVKSAIKNAGTTALGVSRWNFAQTVLSEQSAVWLSADKTLAFVDGVAQELPSSIISAKSSNQISVKSDYFCGFWAFQKQNIDLWQKAFTVSMSAIALCFLIQSGHYFLEWIDNIQKQNLIAQNVGAQNLDALKSDISKLDEIQNTQYGVRKTLSLLKDVPSSARLESVKITDKNMEAVFNATKPIELKTFFAPYKPEALVISGDSVSVIVGVSYK